MYDATRFRYAPASAPSGLVVVVPASVASRQDLFDVLASSLAFPEYFGENWDALVDCLSDLSWINATEITLKHEGLPGLQDRELKTYLECLQDVVERRERGYLPALSVMFPQAVGPEIARVLGTLP
jgi:RNAse (barnase) inhibitor barstar